MHNLTPRCRCSALIDFRTTGFPYACSKTARTRLHLPNLPSATSSNSSTDAAPSARFSSCSPNAVTVWRSAKCSCCTQQQRRFYLHHFHLQSSNAGRPYHILPSAALGTTTAQPHSQRQQYCTAPPPQQRIAATNRSTATADTRHTIATTAAEHG